MPKVLIISDSHGWRDEVSQIKDRHSEEVDQFIHCGDSELETDATELNQYLTVAGNCDFASKFPNEVEITIGTLNFFVTHGHLYDVKSTLMRLDYRAEELGAHVVCHGHSHIAKAEKIGNRIILNPGSIRLPRMRREGTYAIMSWESMDDILIEFYTLQGHKVEDLTFQTSLS
ncbi:metallophosphoesterase family protein [Aquibacillus albus]|uniref:Phosphoesterase n=1 Tax=Aquibacillus albus TaxID=1168171 RepID=A0ABS2N1I7_9BACI|nr:metallophosphoesterase [Aquibacillus albus]MBM7571997.1 putative phosphoesterase [Aquibacillus albus]